MMFWSDQCTAVAYMPDAAYTWKVHWVTWLGDLAAGNGEHLPSDFDLSILEVFHNGSDYKYESFYGFEDEGKC